MGAGIGAGLFPHLHVLEASAHAELDFVGKGGLEGQQVRHGGADQRRADGLMRATLGRERDARGRAHQHEARVHVRAVDERVERTADKRVVPAEGQKKCPPSSSSPPRHGETWRRRWSPESRAEEEAPAGPAQPARCSAARRAAPPSSWRWVSTACPLHRRRLGCTSCSGGAVCRARRCRGRRTPHTG
jgi:hypothetical protein